VLLTDLGLPDSNGIELIRELRERTWLARDGDHRLRRRRGVLSAIEAGALVTC
jgi:DNA-binding NarL/FixJ family response regulator